MNKRSKKKKSERSLPERPPRFLDGHLAAYAVESLVSEITFVQTSRDLTEITGPMRHITHARANSSFREVDDARSVGALLAGAAQSGVRASAFMEHADNLSESLSVMAGRRLPAVVHMTTLARRRQATALRGGHDDYYDAAQSGAVQLFACTPQEVTDLSVIAHRIAEDSLTPAICAQDLYTTSHGIRPVDIVDAGTIERFLGSADDDIDCPTPAQSMLFGKTRRRVPRWVDIDRPAGAGGAQDHESYSKAILAQRAFFAADIRRLVDEAMARFGDVTGRTYEPLQAYRANDAEFVVIAQGAVVDALKPVVDEMRAQKIKAGLIGVTLYRPFPGAQLSALIKGKKVVTVLERTDHPLAEELPLASEVRSVIARARENGDAQRGPLAYEAYESYARRDCPILATGIYGVGGALPNFGYLMSIYRNMAMPESMRRRFYCGAEVSASSDRFPHLQSLQHQLYREYPELDTLTLPASTAPATRHDDAYGVDLFALSSQGGIFAANLFAQALGETLDRQVCTYPSGGLERNMQPARVTLSWTQSAAVPQRRPETPDAILVSAETFVDAVAGDRSIRRGGLVVIESNRPPEDVWKHLSKRSQRWIMEHDLRVTSIDTGRIASETASQPSFADQLGVWALFGNLAGHLEGESALGQVANALERKIAEILGDDHPMIRDVSQCFLRGAAEGVELDSANLAVDGVDIEHEAPWPVRQLPEGDQSVFDVSRFWRSVGYLYESGREHATIVDPYVGTGVLPARSSAFRDATPHRLQVPEWLPERCSGCGECWAACPETALPATIQSVADMMDTAAKATGKPMMQLPRITPTLAKQAHRMVARDDASEHTEAASLLRAAYEQVSGKLGLDEEKQALLKSELDAVCGQFEGVRFAKTDAFFTNRDAHNKGEGRLLFIAVSPLSCTGCGICTAVCPEDAIEATEQTAEHVGTLQTSWRFVMQLPEVSSEEISRVVSDDDSATQVHRLLQKTAYHSLVGGDGSAPGVSAKTAVHLVTAAIESVVRPRIEQHIEQLSDLIDKIQAKIQGSVAGALEINDFEAFSKRLSRVEADRLTPETLTRLVSEENTVHKVDSTRLKRLNDILGRLESVLLAYRSEANNGRRACVVLAVDPDAVSFWSGTYPYNPHAHPWASHLPGDAPALAEGLFEGIARVMASEFELYRTARAELEDRTHTIDGREHLAWSDFTEEEWQLVPPVLVIAHSRVTGWQGIERLIDRGYPVKVLALEDRALTINHNASGEIELGSASERMMSRLGRRPDVFLSQSTVGHPGHLIHSTAQGIAQRMPAVFHVYAPDADSAGVAVEQVMTQARLAHESRVFPLLVREPGSSAPALGDNPDAALPWTSHRVRTQEPSGRETTIDTPLTPAHWAVAEGRFQHHFRIVSRGELADHMLHLSKYVDMPVEERRGVEPYIDVVDDNGRHFLAIVSPAMARATERCRAAWQQLCIPPRSAVAPAPPPDEQAVPKAAATTPAAPEVDRSIYETLTERLLQLSGYGRDPDFFERSLKEFRGNVTENPGD
jgi:pyruvate-ferredoxin/flavodoxin oxidoreductase